MDFTTPPNEQQKEEIRKALANYDLNKKITHDEFIEIAKANHKEVDEEKLKGILKSKDTKGEEGLVDLKKFLEVINNS